MSIEIIIWRKRNASKFNYCLLTLTMTLVMSIKIVKFKLYYVMPKEAATTESGTMSLNGDALK